MRSASFFGQLLDLLRQLERESSSGIQLPWRWQCPAMPGAVFWSCLDGHTLCLVPFPRKQDRLLSNDDGRLTGSKCVHSHSCIDSITYIIQMIIYHHISIYFIWRGEGQATLGHIQCSWTYAYAHEDQEEQQQQQLTTNITGTQQYVSHLQSSLSGCKTPIQSLLSGTQIGTFQTRLGRHGVH